MHIQLLFPAFNAVMQMIDEGSTGKWSAVYLWRIISGELTIFRKGNIQHSLTEKPVRLSVETLNYTLKTILQKNKFLRSCKCYWYFQYQWREGGPS